MGIRLKLMQFNVQDLFIDLAFSVNASDVDALNEQEWQLLGKTDVALKPIAKLRAIAKIIEEEEVDIVCINEAGGPNALHQFVRLFLPGYSAHIERGNDQRGIDTGFLLRKSANLRAELRSHRDYPVPFTYPFEEDPEHFSVAALSAKSIALDKPSDRRFSRDVPELRLFKDGERDPFIVFLGVHLKSPLDRDNIDSNGVVRRQAELNALIRLRHDLQNSLPQTTPIVVMGDFNTNASEFHTSSEALPIYAFTDLRDVLALTQKDTHERITQMSFFVGNISARQIDYIFLPTLLHNSIKAEETRVYRYLFNEDRTEVQLPFNSFERRALPSDHYPVITVLNM